MTGPADFFQLAVYVDARELVACCERRGDSFPPVGERVDPAFFSFPAALDEAFRRVAYALAEGDLTKCSWGLRVAVDDGVRYEFGDWSHSNEPWTAQYRTEPAPDIASAWVECDAGRTPSDALALARRIIEQYVATAA